MSRIVAPGLAARLFLSLTLVAGVPAIAAAGKKDDTLVWSTERDNPIADPFYINTRELVIIGHHAWDTLMIVDPADNTIKPLLAKSWKWDGDLALELELRSDVKFHNGKDMDAEDVAYTLNHISNKDNAVLNYSMVNWIKSAEAKGKYTVRINLARPFPPAFAYLANSSFIMPKGHYDAAPTRPDGKKDFGAVKPVGTGPYRVADVKPGEYILLERFDGYFKDSFKGRPAIGKIRFRTIKDNNTRAAEAMTGAVDWMWEMPKDVAERMARSPNLVVETAKTLRIGYFQFDVNGTSGQKFFTDRRVRQAFIHAINREAMIKNLVGPGSVIPAGPCHPEQFACAQDIATYDYNPDKARKLLAEAGYPNGFEVELFGYRDRDILEAAIGDLGKVGIKAKLNFMQYVTFLDNVRKGKVPVGHATWGSNSIPDVSAATAHFFGGGPDDMAKDPVVIAGIAKADSLIDPEQRKAAWKDVLNRIQSEAYWMSLFTYTKYQAWTKDLDYKPTSDEIPQFYKARWK